jgi:hypothetical protein
MSADVDLPDFAAWRHYAVRDGFEIVFFDAWHGGLRVTGNTTAIEAGEPFTVGYAIELDASWRTRFARITGQSRRAHHSVTVATDGTGTWTVDDRPAPHLDGCLDVDLESSALTNAFPMHRLGLEPGEAADAPAAYVRALDLAVDRFEQRYRRTDDAAGPKRFDYSAPAFDFSCELVYDESGLVVDYPGLAARVLS